MNFIKKRVMNHLNKNSLIFRQLFDKESSTYTYLLGDAQSKEAILIDPVLEQVERDLQIINDLNIVLKYAINTHCHADHITGSGELKKRFPNVKSIISRDSQAQADILIKENDLIQFGQFQLHSIATPGHTDGCMSFYFKEFGAVFTGDALLIRGCGRTDFQQGDAGKLYEMIKTKIFTLPPETQVFPAHDYKGFTMSTIDEEIRLNPRFAKDKESFIKFMKELGLPYPKKIDASLPANLKCGL